MKMVTLLPHLKGANPQRVEYVGKHESKPDHYIVKSTDAFGRPTTLVVYKSMIKEEAPANSVGGGKIAGMGVGPQGEPGVGPKAMKRYKDKNAAEAPRAGRKTFTMFMQGK